MNATAFSRERLPLRQEPGSSRKEFTDCRGDLLRMRFQREVTGIVEANIGVGDVPLERLCARRKEERIVLPPHRKKPRLVLAEIRLERWIERDVALVVTEQDRKSTRLNSSHLGISYAVFCLKKK